MKQSAKDEPAFEEVLAYGRMFRLATRRLRMGTIDLRIAVSLGLVLLTRNVGDFDKVAALPFESIQL